MHFWEAVFFCHHLPSDQATTYGQNKPPQTPNPPHSLQINYVRDKSSLTTNCARLSILQRPL